MRGPGEILLVACYELGHQPLAVAWPAAVLERAGFRPAVMDVSVEPFDEDKARRARLVAVSVPMHTALRVGLGVAARVRAASPAAHLCMYGLYASLNAEHLYAQGVDSVVAGELEEALVDLARSLEAGGGRVLGPLPGVARPGQPALPRLSRQDLPVPARAALPSIKKYARLRREGRLELAGHVEATRGCLHTCRHCPIPPVYGGRFVAVPLESVLADVRQQVEAGAGHVTFGDPDFLNGPTHAVRVARSLHAAFPHLTFDFTAKVEHLLRHRTLLPELERQGAIFVVSAVESLSDTVLGHLAKGHTRADVHEALRVTREAGLALRPTWVAFTPWTTLEDYLDMLEFVAVRGLVDHVDPVQYSLRLLVPPGSLLLGVEALRPHLGPLVPEDFSHRWTHPDPRMERLQRAVTAVVANAAEGDEDAAVTFDRVRALADETAGRPPRPAIAPGLAPGRRRPPSLSEPWFC